jgi:major membrane immunogen (membrane-anchored lipoprotein)
MKNRRNKSPLYYYVRSGPFSSIFFQNSWQLAQSSDNLNRIRLCLSWSGGAAMFLSHWQMRWLTGILILTAFSAAAGFAETVEEKFPNGQVKLRYSVDGQNRKNGMLEEFFESGKLKLKTNYKDDEQEGNSITYYESGKIQITANYRKGKLHGAYAEYTEAGIKKLTAVYSDGKLNGPYLECTDGGVKKRAATYKDGKLHGTQTQFENGKTVSTQLYREGDLVSGRTAAEIKKAIADIIAVPKNKMSAETAEIETAFRHLKAYRYLAEVPNEKVTLDPEHIRHCVAASKICEKIGRLDHMPPNPGWPEADYQFAFEATTHSNLAKNTANLSKSVDEWMDDSDPPNIDRVGHRRWCLNPVMDKIGLGKSGKYSAMWAWAKPPEYSDDFDYVTWPAKGLMPTEFFGPKIAWSVSFNPQKYSFVPSAIKVKVFELEKNLEKGKAIRLSNFNADTANAAIPNCVIFLPVGVDLTPGKRYMVEIDGVGEATVRYFVEFMRLN